MVHVNVIDWKCMTLPFTFLFTAYLDSLSVRCGPVATVNGARSVGQNENQRRVASVAQSVRQLPTVTDVSSALSVRFFLSSHNNNNFMVIPFYFQSVLVHSANCVKTYTMRVEECSVALHCNS
jgi:hypothetical protein